MIITMHHPLVLGFQTCAHLIQLCFQGVILVLAVEAGRAHWIRSCRGSLEADRGTKRAESFSFEGTQIKTCVKHGCFQEYGYPKMDGL